MFTVYVLRSLKNGRMYIGHTDNIERRLEEHNSGRSRYTHTTRPFELIYSEVYKSRSEAAKRELQLKSGQGRLWLRKVVGRAVA